VLYTAKGIVPLQTSLSCELQHCVKLLAIVMTSIILQSRDYPIPWSHAVAFNMHRWNS